MFRPRIACLSMTLALVACCAAADPVDTCKKIKLGADVATLHDVQPDPASCGTGSSVYSLGPVEDIACCRRNFGPCAVDCSSTGYADPKLHQVGRSAHDPDI